METKSKRVKTGGRSKGTPNKVSAPIKTAIADMLKQYHDSGDMQRDFLSLDSRDRIMVAEKFMPYIMPKMQSVQADIKAGIDVTTLDQKLAELAKE